MNLASWLLAQRSRWERLGDKFSGRNAEIDSQELTTLLVAIAGAVVLIVALMCFARWQDGRERRPNPRRLFRELCRAHSLNNAERRTLRSLAGACGVGQPAEVFVRPEIFKREAALRRAKLRAETLDGLREKLFPGLD